MWETAYENQIETWAFWQTEIAQRYAEGFRQDVINKGGDGTLMSHLVEYESTKLLAADPIYVEDEMETLWENAASEFKPEPFESTDLLCPAGFVYLPRPQYMYDIHGKACAWRAISWATMGYELGDDAPPTLIRGVDPVTGKKIGALGINISLYSHRDDPDDYDWQSRLDEDEETRAIYRRYPLALLHMDTWKMGQSFEEVTQNVESWRDRPITAKQREHATLGHFDTWRKVQALFRLFQEHVAIPAQQAAPRSTRKRVARKGFTVKPVTVIRLRRPKNPRKAEDPTPVDWSHRWPVRGHWRNQWYPSLGIHRQKFIGLYIKGPEDKPLYLPEKRAFELVQ